MLAFRRAGLALVLCSTLAVVSCSSPPDKEMNQAQGALDAARAAGADQYATEEYQAGVQALSRARDAVGQRDYRLALSSALDALERAQNAAREAANQKAVARSEADRALTAALHAITPLEERLGVAEEAGVQANELEGLRAALKAATDSVQEARAALEREEYIAARKRLEALPASLAQTTAAIDAAIAAIPPRPVKRRGR